MTDREIIAAISQAIAPNPWFREDRRKRPGKALGDASKRDMREILTADRKAERAVARLRELGALE